MEDTDKNLKKINLNDIKSKYIFKKIFDYIQKTKYLNLISNKNIQSKLNVDLNLYKECTQIKLELEVEIKEKSKKIDKLDSDYIYDLDIGFYGFNRYEKEEENYYFMIIKEQFKPYFHFYFDNDEKRKKIGFC